MELRQLRYFVAVAEELHYGRAAGRLSITSPSLSQQIKALERDLGVLLFERSSAGVRLAPAGAQLLPLARETLGAAEELSRAAHRIRQRRSTVLRLGFLTFALTSVTRRLLADFDRSVPDVMLQLHQHEWDDPSGGLLSGSTDAALVRPPFSGDEQLEMLDLASEGLLAIVAEDHELATAGTVTLARLAREPWIETELVRDPVFARFWFARGVRGPDSPTVPSRATALEEWLTEVALGRGVDMVPTGAAEEYRKPGLAFVPVSDAERSRVVLAWRRGHTSPAVATLVRFASARRDGTVAPAPYAQVRMSTAP